MFYTPDDFANFIKIKFNAYRDARKPEVLKDLQEVKLDSPKETFEQFKQDPKETSKKVLEFVKYKISDVAGQLRTHSKAIAIIEAEVDKINAEELTSPLKKICDMAILLYGLIGYLHHRESEQLMIFVTEIKEELWRDTPEFDEQTFVKLFSKEMVNVRDHLEFQEFTDPAARIALAYRSTEAVQQNNGGMEEVGPTPTAYLGECYFRLLVETPHVLEPAVSPANYGQNDNNVPLVRDEKPIERRAPRVQPQGWYDLFGSSDAPVAPVLGKNNRLVVMNSSEDDVQSRVGELPIPVAVQSGDEEDDVSPNPFK